MTYAKRKLKLSGDAIGSKFISPIALFVTYTRDGIEDMYSATFDLTYAT